MIPNAPDLAGRVVRNGEADAARPTVVFLGHLKREKGVYELVEACASLRRDRPGLKLVLAGEGQSFDHDLSDLRVRIGETIQKWRG